jgi:mRNA-degrading endonuclease RelE of RelBE toxin-antitoxin system
MWEVVIAASVEPQLGRLPSKVAPAIVEFMLGPLSENPHRVGHPLQRELASLWSARRGAYRIACDIDDERRTITVLRIDRAPEHSNHRRDAPASGRRRRRCVPRPAARHRMRRGADPSGDSQRPSSSTRPRGPIACVRSGWCTSGSA